MPESADVVIVGGGPVGSALALALRESGLRITLLEARAAAIATVKPGVRWNVPHDAAVAVLAQGFIDLKLLQGSLNEVLEQETYKQFYMWLPIASQHWLALRIFLLHCHLQYCPTQPHPSMLVLQ